MDKKNYKEKILVYIGENMPKISILIPIYNVEKYLQDCLESVIHQTERDIEIICVDDASVDGSLKILQEYVNRDNRLKLLKHTENKGLCKTRKDAVEVATGKYILFLDSDDYLSLDTCEKLFAFMETGKYDFLQFGANIIPEGNVSDDMIATVYKGNIIKNLIMDCQSYTKYRPNETTGGIFVSWRRKEELPTGG